jgi:hypothetical protein
MLEEVIISCYKIILILVSESEKPRNTIVTLSYAHVQN